MLNTPLERKLVVGAVGRRAERHANKVAADLLDAAARDGAAGSDKNALARLDLIRAHDLTPLAVPPPSMHGA
jgi:hypothetical protein